MNFVHFTLVTMCAFVYILSVSVGSTDALDKCYTCGGNVTSEDYAQCKSEIEKTCAAMNAPAVENKKQVCYTIKGTRKEDGVHLIFKGCAYEGDADNTCTDAKNSPLTKDVSCKNCEKELCNGAGIYTASAVFVAILTALVTRAL